MPEKFHTSTTIERSEYTRPQSRRVYREYVLVTAAYYFVYGAILGFSLLMFLLQSIAAFYTPELRWVFVWLALFGGGASGAAWALVKLGQLWAEWEAHNETRRVMEKAVPFVPETKPKRERPLTINGVPTYRRADVTLMYRDNDGKVWKWKWYGAELDTMLRWYNHNDVRMRRDGDKAAGRNGVTDIERIGKDDYSTIQKVMQGLGLVDDKMIWTAAGKIWLETAGLDEGE